MPTRSLVRHALVLAALACLSVAHAHAQDRYYTNDSTINYLVISAAIVGYANHNDETGRTNGTSPTINFVSGGNIFGSLLAYNSSIVNVSGGRINYSIRANDSSTVNVSGGDIFAGGLYTLATSKVNISGGNIYGLMEARDKSAVTVSGGRIDTALFALDNSTVTISGGAVGKFSGTEVNFVDQTAGVFTLVGSNLKVFNARADTRFGGTDYDLSGTLRDGTNLNGYVLNVGTNSTFKLQAVPEMSTVVALPVLLATLSAGLVRKHRSRS